MLIPVLVSMLLGAGTATAADIVAQRLERPQTQTRPRQVAQGPTIEVAADSLRPDPATELLQVEADVPDRIRDLPPQLWKDAIRVERQVAAWLRRGRAAGNAGDIYDNRDRGHSRLPADRFPSLTHSTYDEDAKAAGLDYGLNTVIRFPAPTFGNSSTALTGGVLWRSQTRMAMTAQESMLRVEALYRANHLYVYPEHRDHDPNRGDLFPAAIPYLITSQGSSGSDKPFLNAIALIMAAYQPETKAALIERGELAAVTGMILRRGMRGIETDADYLSGLAHPSAFERDDIELDRMIVLANAITPDRLPPNIRLRVLDAPRSIPGQTSFLDGGGETVFATDAAIGWIARAMAPSWRFVLSAASDAPAAETRFHWKILRGDESRITLRPIGPDGARVELVIPWHDPYPVPGQPEMSTQRVDIGVFAEAAGGLSPPAFFSLSFPPLERRTYAPDGRLLSVTHQPHGRDAPYADPRLYPSADWTDHFDYDEDGRLLGWTRESGAGTQHFTRHGLLVTDWDAFGRPLEARTVIYPVEPGTRRQPPSVLPQITEERWQYRYDDREDRLGVATVIN